MRSFSEVHRVSSNRNSSSSSVASSTENAFFTSSSLHPRRFRLGGGGTAAATSFAGNILTLTRKHRPAGSTISGSSRSFLSLPEEENENEDSMLHDSSDFSIEEPSKANKAQHQDFGSHRSFLLELSDNLEDIEDSYMLSVFFRADDSSASGSVRTKETASTNSTASTRRRSPGAYQQRLLAGRAATTNRTTWRESFQHAAEGLRSNKEWNAKTGWEQRPVQKFRSRNSHQPWEAKPHDIDQWESLDPVFDKGVPPERIEI